MAGDKTERQLCLVALLLGKPEPGPMTFAEIRKYIEDYRGASYDAAIRMFERDKSDLRALGIPLDTTSTDPLSDGAEAYRIDRRRFVLPALRPSPDEIFLLQVIGASLRNEARFPLRAALASALAKLSCRAGFDLLHEADAEAPVRVLWDTSSASQGSQHVDPLLGAVRARKNVMLSYQPARGGDAVERTVSPYGLYCRGSVWYLVGHCHLRQGIRVFRLSRIRSLAANTHSPRKPDFSIPDDFAVRDYLALTPWALGEGPEITVTVRLADDVFWRVESAICSLGTTAEDDGGVRWTVTVQDLDRFGLWLVSLGPGAQLMGPPEAVEHLRQRVAALRVRYDAEG